MFTGFASENTPAIQVWDFFTTFASTSAIRSVSLADDCAPIQIFRTGATGQSAIRIYLPTAPIEGKQITIVNQKYGGGAQFIEIYSSDTSQSGATSPLFTMGAADSIIFVYSKQNISYGPLAGVFQTGWIPSNRCSPSAGNAFSAVVGGNINAASGQYSFVGGGQTNVASGTNAAVVGGSSNTASQTGCIVAGGASNSATNTYASVFGGSSNSASSLGATVVGGDNNSATGSNAVVIGGVSGSSRSIIGNFVTPASNVPISFNAQQLGTLLLARQTNNATATVLTSNTSAAGNTNQVILPNNSAYTFQGTCIAARTAAGDTSSWKFEGAIKRGANAASTALVAAVTPTVIAQDAGAATWVLAITADTTNGGIKVEVTGAAATTIRWVVKIETTEVTF